MVNLQKIVPHLWFSEQAEDAANYYVSIFRKSHMGKISRYGKEGYPVHKRPAGSVMSVELWLEGVKFVALNGGPLFKFNEAVSFIIECETQDEINYYWEKLARGGDEKAQQCG